MPNFHLQTAEACLTFFPVSVPATWNYAKVCNCLSSHTKLGTSATTCKAHALQSLPLGQGTVWERHCQPPRSGWQPWSASWRSMSSVGAGFQGSSFIWFAERLVALCLMILVDSKSTCDAIDSWDSCPLGVNTAD